MRRVRGFADWGSGLGAVIPGTQEGPSRPPRKAGRTLRIASSRWGEIES
jgi:hypothetical protein